MFIRQRQNSQKVSTVLMSVSSNTVFPILLNRMCDPRGFRSNSKKPLPEGLVLTHRAFFLAEPFLAQPFLDGAHHFCRNVDSVQFLPIPPIQRIFSPLLQDCDPKGSYLARPLPVAQRIYTLSHFFFGGFPVSSRQGQWLMFTTNRLTHPSTGYDVMAAFQ